MKRAHIVPGAVVVLLLFATALTSYLVTKNYYVGLFSRVELVHDPDSHKEYQFISPLINVRIPKEIGTDEFASILQKVRAAASGEKSLIRYSFYFKELSNGRWTGINETDLYNPASMLKVVAAIAAYKQEEDAPGFINSSAVYTRQLADINAEFPFAPQTALSVGMSYRIPFLLKSMLSDSDNASKDLLLSAINPNELSEIYTDLLIQGPDENDSSGYTISALDYSRFFRVLYNSTYLTRANSEKVLGYLASATYAQGLVAGVASSTPVAHKFGEHINGSGDEISSIELHDCGIVYHPGAPYFICVMTEGRDEAALASFIAKASNIAYAEVSAGYR